MTLALAARRAAPKVTRISPRLSPAGHAKALRPVSHGRHASSKKAAASPNARENRGYGRKEPRYGVADEHVGGVALPIDAKNDRAARWYESHGALVMADAPLSLVLPLAVAADAIRRGS